MQDAMARQYEIKEHEVRALTDQLRDAESAREEAERRLKEATTVEPAAPADEADESSFGGVGKGGLLGRGGGSPPRGGSPKLGEGRRSAMGRGAREQSKQPKTKSAVGMGSSLGAMAEEDGQKEADDTTGTYAAEQGTATELFAKFANRKDGVNKRGVNASSTEMKLAKAWSQTYHPLL